MGIGWRIALKTQKEQLSITGGATVREGKSRVTGYYRICKGIDPVESLGAVACRKF
jgi:hypothetical protein